MPTSTSRSSRISSATRARPRRASTNRTPRDDSAKAWSAGAIVEVIWDDHTFEFGSFARKGVQRQTTIGQFVEQTDGWIAIALTVNSDGYADTQTIDKRMVISTRRLR